MNDPDTFQDAEVLRHCLAGQFRPRGELRDRMWLPATKADNQRQSGFIA
jgi:hypothetical protein